MNKSLQECRDRHRELAAISIAADGTIAWGKNQRSLTRGLPRRRKN